MGRISELKANALYTLREEGVSYFSDRVKAHLNAAINSRGNAPDPLDVCTDVLFINGCAYSVPHPIRYRVDHQIEQLHAVGVSARKIDEWNLTNDYARTARLFVIFRCPYNDRVGEFIRLAKSLNKTVLFDIDDLVIDRKYTDTISYLDSLSPEDRAGYDAGVDAMQKTMMLCDAVVTSTDGLAAELRNYRETVFVNRNVASEEMVRLSQRAVEERDIFPFTPECSVPAHEKTRWKNACKRNESRDDSLVHIGYFSGSITHNDDFNLILSSLTKIMKSRPNVRLHVIGELTLPEELQPFAERVEAAPFLPWRRLPRLISEMDINLAPLTDSVFNRAKSENKWVEAGLVKVPTIASNIGALSDSIENWETGVLCDNTEESWSTALIRLVDSKSLRNEIGEKAYVKCLETRTTIGTGSKLASFLRSQTTKGVAFCLPSLDISGGVLVALRHASFLNKRGYDVTIVDGSGDQRWTEYSGCSFPVINRRVMPTKIDDCPIDMTFDSMVATFWETAMFVDRYSKAKQKFYLVQNRETDFYRPGTKDRMDASATYGIGKMTYLTISRWCEEWMRDQYGLEPRFARNGLDLSEFRVRERDYSGRIRILVEGDSSAEHKNVDESFKIVDKLGRDKYEIWYLSYKGEPKDSYRVDKFLKAVPHSEISEVYEQCHILLKTSVLESFSYPPLEMMATGGLAVVLSNQGNAEYLVDRENCLLFDRGEDEKAASLIEELAENPALREKLRAGGLETARSRDWNALESEAVALYE